MRKIPGPLNTQICSGFRANSGAMAWNCQPVTASYCFDTRESNDSLVANHEGYGLSLKAMSHKDKRISVITVRKTLDSTRYGSYIDCFLTSSNDRQNINDRKMQIWSSWKTYMSSTMLDWYLLKKKDVWGRDLFDRKIRGQFIDILSSL